MSYTLEKMWEIWNDKTGERLEIGPDRDALDLIEFRDINTEGKVCGRVTLTKEQLPLVIEALQKMLV